MCQSQAEGGLRCAAHTGPRFRAAAFGTPAWDTAAAEYASTRSGAAALTALRDAAAGEGDLAREVALTHALTEGARRKESAGEVRHALASVGNGARKVKASATGAPGKKPALTLIQGGRSSETAAGDEPDTFCDWCWTDPGPDGDCDCP